MKKLFYVLTVVTVAASFACSSNTAGNNANAPRPANSGNIANATPVATPAVSPATETKTGSMATPTETYKAAYEYRKKGDIAGMKKVMSKDVLEFMTELGKVENKTLDDMLMETVKEPQADTSDTRNEKITGDTATLEYLTKGGSWKTMDFIREGAEWKMTIPKGPDGEKKK